MSDEATAIDPMPRAGGDGRLAIFVTRVLPIVLMVLSGWSLAYASGLAPWFGYESRSDTLRSASLSGGGFEIGASAFVLFEGQTAIIEYDFEESTNGLLEVSVRRMLGHPSQGHEHFEWLRETGKGRVSVPIRQTGLYAIEIGARAAGDGDYSATYTARWGASFGAPVGLSRETAAAR